MPSSDYSSVVEQRPVSRSTHLTGGPPEKDQQLRCPRCDSINTKFCYYNNYNLSQPRHFCKGCRRYWTQGGALRDVPVGGGTRKNSCKRTRKPSSSSYSYSSLSPVPEPVFANPNSSQPIPTSVSATISVRSADVHHFNGVGGSFASLLNPQPSPTLLAYNGFGLGHGSAFDEMVTFENKGMVWPLGFGENTHSGGIGLIGGGIGNTWQLGIGGAGGDASGGGGGDGDFFTWPELGMSTPRKGVK